VGSGEDVVTVVGIGADGWAGLPESSRAALREAGVVLGSRRQLDLLPPEVAAERVPWPSPMAPAVEPLVRAHAGRRTAALASGDPSFHGLGTTLVRLLGAERVRVLPHPSAASLACARLGWPLDATEVVSTVGKPVELLHRAVQPGRRLLVLSAGAETPAAVAALLTGRGYGDSRLTVLANLGAADEHVTAATAAQWPSGAAAPLNVVAVECVADPGTPLRAAVPGLPDDAFEHDGQLTKREVRAVTLARLAPVPGRLLWDVGAGSGSVAIEWARTHPSCCAAAVEADATRAARIARNAAALGVPGVDVVHGAAPEALDGLDPPDAVFVGGGTTAPGLLEACWSALSTGGRLVVNAVTVESEAVVLRWHEKIGGDLTRIAVDRAAPVGGFTGWRPLMPVTQWVAIKP
jgi:precorrin-6B C5,15-methyltransferase / cobalt-precorrin-6B C5,C15-methyltransferase